MPIPDFDPKRYEQWIDDIRFDIDYANHQINDETENLLTHQGRMIGVTLAKTDFDPKRYEQWIDDIRFDIDYANHQINDETENLLTHQGRMIGVTLAKTLPTEDIEHIIEALKPIMRRRDTDASVTPIVFGMNSTLVTELATRHWRHIGENPADRRHRTYHRGTETHHAQA